MGAYIDPKDCSKEKWLQEHAAQLAFLPHWDEIPIGSLLVVLVDNGPFTAAAIVFSMGEYGAFTMANDPRPKKFFVANTAKLLDVCPCLVEYLRPTQV